MHPILKTYKFTFCFMVLMLVALLMPMSSQEVGEPGMVSQILTIVPFTDKLAHMGMFFLLTWINVLENRRKSWLTSVLWVVILCGFAVATEYLQKWTGYRTFDLADMVADVVGIALGLAAAKGLEHGFKKSE